MLNHALRYLNIGLSVIPLRPKGKEPLIKWEEFQKRRATPEEVKGWFVRWPTANIGIVAGAISRIVVVDLDGPEGITQALLMKLSSSVISLTGNGKHLWYRNPLNTVGNAVRLLPGVDVRGEGGYVVAPPSVHENGRRYRWLNPLNPNFLPNFPSGLIPQESTGLLTTISHTSKEESRSEFKPKLDIAKALQEMKNGNIDDTLFTICSRLRADGYTDSDARVLLEPHADKAGATRGHLDDKIKNVWERYEPRKPADLRMDRCTGQPGSNLDNGLVIHSPTNPDSLKQYEQCRMDIQPGERGLQTGYPKLDVMLQGGLKSSRLFTVAARTGTGKTNWLLGVTREVCRSGKTVLLFSTEMPFKQIWDRYIATLEDPEEFKRHKFYICDSFAPNLEKVEAAINEIKPDVFMFDHINHISEEQRELGTFMQGLNYLRRKYECAGIVTAQLNRSADWVDLKTGEKVTPRMSMIKGSGTIEQASSRVLLLSDTRVTPEGTEIVGNLDKNDDGPKGLVHFMLRSNPYRMEEI